MTAIRKRTPESTQTQIRRRKRLINNRRVPLEVIFPSTNRASGSIYIVARPVTKAWHFNIMMDSAWRRGLSSNRPLRWRQSASIFRDDIETSPFRSVYIVARPITKAKEWSVGFFSDHSFPFCHWGLVVSTYDESELRQHISHQAENRYHSSLLPWGTLFELFNRSGQCMVNVVEDFGWNSCLCDWSTFLIRHVGRTQMPDGEIQKHGIAIS